MIPDQAFPNLLSSLTRALDDAQQLSNQNGAPVGVWDRQGWYAVCETPPEDIEPSPESEGWTLHAVVDPQEYLES